MIVMLSAESQAYADFLGDPVYPYFDKDTSPNLDPTRNPIPEKFILKNEPLQTSLNLVSPDGVVYSYFSEPIEYVIDQVDDFTEQVEYSIIKNSGDCNDCTPPTLGYDGTGVKRVDNGVCINNSCMDGGYFHTKYTIQSTLLYFPNTISTTYYENQGSHNIKLVQLGIGVKEIGSPISQSQALIEVWLNRFSNDIDNPTIKEIILIDPDGIIAHHDATVQLVPCMDDASVSCLKIDFKYSYSLVPNSPILMSNAIDFSRNVINNYFNDGLDVVRYTSEIVPEEIKERVCDDPIKSVITRNNCHFELLINYEIEKAMKYY